MVTELDVGDDLGRTADADIVISTAGNPHILTREHLREHHRLVVNAGFSPRGGGVVFGDIHPDALAIAQYRTPVPGGVGPVEMAVLMERLVRQTVDSALPAWRLPRLPYRHRGHTATPPPQAPPAPRARPLRPPPGTMNQHNDQRHTGAPRRGGDPRPAGDQATMMSLLGGQCGHRGWHQRYVG